LGGYNSTLQKKSRGPTTATDGETRVKGVVGAKWLETGVENVPQNKRKRSLQPNLNKNR